MKFAKRMSAFVMLLAVLMIGAGGTSVGPGKPDLAIQVLAAGDSSTTFDEGFIFGTEYPQLILKNVGTGPTTGHYITTFKCKTVPGSGPGGTTPACSCPAEEKFGTVSVPVLAPGQPWTLWVKPTFIPLSAGKYVLSGLVELDEDDNKSNNYAEITITVKPPMKSITINPVLAAPTLVSVAPKNSITPTMAVILTYREHSEIRRTKGVVIERKTAADGVYNVIAKTVPSGPLRIDRGAGVQKTYEDGPLSARTYYYRLKAYDDKGESEYSNEMSITIKNSVQQPMIPVKK
jgi:hypothetical protein